MTLTLKNILLNLVYYAITVVALPGVCLWADARWGPWRHERGRLLEVTSSVLIACGAGLQIWCIIMFQRLGRGTPSPAIPPERLVTTGPYRYLRNPINLGEVMVFLGLAGWFASLGLLLYALAAAVCFHLFIVAWEEPAHHRKFGEDYVLYRKAVNRWLPRMPRASENDPGKRRPAR
ncbi:MAG: phosphatidylethanolamine N-methyltransferase family protein [Planctomycetes bacterium]|nr:phosphatidylethanolamine N-methyltransferase family protein [Planctomycetota bacterium]